MFKLLFWAFAGGLAHGFAAGVRGRAWRWLTGA